MFFDPHPILSSLCIAILKPRALYQSIAFPKKIYIPKQSSAQNLDPGKHPDNHGPNITNQSSSWVARSPANTVVPLTTTAANTTLPAPTMTGTKSKEAIYRTDSKGSTGAVGIKRTRRDMRNRYAMQRSANGTAGH